MPEANPHRPTVEWGGVGVVMTRSSDRCNSSGQVVAQSVAAFADTLVDDFDMVELLDQLMAACLDLLGVRAAGILLVDSANRLEVAGSSNADSRLLELFQLESKGGPCIDAVRSGRALSITDPVEIDRRWPDFGSAARSLGYSAVYALPMRFGEDTIGALNLFDAGRPPISDHDRHVAQALADVASIGVLQQRSLTRAMTLADQLRLALDTRIAVEQAKGLIAEYAGVDMGVAFEAIRRFARHHRLKIAAVAESLVARELDPATILSSRHTADQGDDATSV
jgi:GAF domain-containing protein